MFFGTYTHSLDAKGRIIIPAGYREELGNQFLLMRGIEECLYVYPRTEMKELEEQFNAISRTDRKGQDYIRMFTANMTICDFDRQGRIGVPVELRKYAGLKKDAVVIGAFNRVEIWSAEKWDEYNARVEGNVGDILEYVTTKTEKSE